MAVAKTHRRPALPEKRTALTSRLMASSPLAGPATETDACPVFWGDWFAWKIWLTCYVLMWLTGLVGLLAGFFSR